MKRLIYITLALLSICGCVEETPTVTLGSVSSSNFDGTTVKLTGEAQSFDVTLDGNGWRYASPSADTWIICEKTSESTLTVYVTRNTGSASRTSHFLVYAGKETVSIQVEQDYWRYFTFYSEDNLIAPSAGEYKIAASTNLTAEEMTLSASEDWVSGLHVDNGWLYFTVSANASGAARPATLSISSELVNESAKITQGVGAAKAVIMSSISLDLDTYPVYEARNPEDNSLVGLVCKEYLFKLGENGTAEVDGSYTVIYPILDGEPDYTRGTILQNGGRVIWNTKTTTATPGNEMIARIEMGSAEASLLAWLPTGKVDLVTTEPTEEEANAAVIATYTPMIVKDTRKGEADSRENTEET
ncbi:MAG: BACON domain-containing protein, partial [Bacteroidales bacterium]|nr:BACON domain-containing protein [Bacteroidales bacterium]